MIDSAYVTYLRDVRRVSPNTVESYARDLSQLAAFAEKTGRPVEALDRKDLEAFVRSLMTAGLAPRSVARLVACLRGFYKFVVVENKLTKNPAEDLRSPRGWASLPKFLSLEEVDRLLAQPDVATPKGLRDKALIELLYATGLRVSELVSLRAGDLHLDEGYLTCVGKGDKQRMVPMGHDAALWVQRYIREGRPAILKKRSSPVAVRQHPRRRVVARRILEDSEGVRKEGRAPRRSESPRAPPFLCDASARARRRSPHDPGNAGPRGPVDDADLHARPRGEIEGGL